MNVAALRRLIVALLLANAAAAGIVWACGPFLVDVATVTAVDPPDREAFEQGAIGVVRPRFRRALLALAYRTLNGQPPLSVETSSAQFSDGQTPDDSVWRELRDRVLGVAPASTSRTPRVREYVTPINCMQDAIDTAVHTFEQRQATYGANSPQLREWVRAQDAVFANCEQEPLSLPAPAPATADALTKADRAYQTAAAYFYAMQYEEAARRFRAIADDATSPWRPYGRYLSARAHIRMQTMSEFTAAKPPATALADAEKELLATIDDPIAAPVHDSARGLLTFVRIRLRPNDELRRISTSIATDRAVACCPIRDFTYLLDRTVGDTIDYAYGSAPPDARDAHDMVDWILALQGTGDEARERAVSQWQRTQSLPWLVAALSQVHGEHPAADALLAAAARVAASSTGFASVSFYRVRLLIALGRTDAARAVLAALPDRASDDTTVETINLYRAERLMVARTFDDMLRASVRISLQQVTKEPASLAIFDDDAGQIFDRHLPIDRLVAAAQSTLLPDRLRARVASAAFTRAAMLGRHDQALAVAPILRALAPDLAADLDRYVSERTADGRHRAFVLLLLRTPGLTSDVRGLDDSYSIDYVEPRRTFDNWLPVWWCTAPQVSIGHTPSELLRTLYPSGAVAAPAFLTAEEQAATERERTAIARLGNATNYLAKGAIQWAQQRPSDPAAAEALSRIVNGWRRACRDERDADLARQAFETLHRQFPDSDWAKQTKYWYR
jgi:hypothetical protein